MPEETHMPTQKNVTITVQNGKIECSGGGYVRTQRLGRISWECDEEFTLAFETLADHRPAWPFRHPNPPFVQTRSFAGELKDVGPDDQAPAYKYTVTIGNHKLDPIIIVDK
jgi:hypothetical protein